MDIRIFNSSLTLKSISDAALTVTASESFSAPGACTLAVPLSDARRFMAGDVLVIPGIGAFTVGEIREDAAEGIATVKGRGILSYFEGRQMPEYRRVSGDAETVLLGLSSEWGASVLPAPLSTVEYGFPEAVDMVIGGGSLLSAMKSVCRASGLGMRLAVTDGGFLFAAQSRTAAKLRLSRGGGDLTGGVRVTEGENYKNSVIVKGYDGRTVTVSAVGLFDDGIDDAAAPLSEIYHNAYKIAPSLFPSDEEYLLTLRAEGKRVLAEHRGIRSVSIDVSAAAAASLHVGEECLIEDDLFGIVGTAFCEEKTVCADETGIRHTVSVRLTR